MSLDYTNGICKISGDLNFERATEIFHSINISNIAQQQLEIDFSQVEQSDSAALAVMLEWTSQAKKCQKQISFVNVPDQLMRLIKMVDLQKIVNLA